MNDVERLPEIDAADAANNSFLVGDHPSLNLHLDRNTIPYFRSIVTGCTRRMQIQPKDRSSLTLGNFAGNAEWLPCQLLISGGKSFGLFHKL